MTPSEKYGRIRIETDGTPNNVKISDAKGNQITAAIEAIFIEIQPDALVTATVRFAFAEVYSDAVLKIQ